MLWFLTVLRCAHHMGQLKGEIQVEGEGPMFKAERQGRPGGDPKFGDHQDFGLDLDHEFFFEKKFFGLPYGKVFFGRSLSLSHFSLFLMSLFFLDFFEKFLVSK